MTTSDVQQIGRIAPDFHCGELLSCGGVAVVLRPPAVMGILNITPDSFSDGGELCDQHGVRLSAVLQRADAMVAAGATILDIGGESTRPGAAPVASQQEIDRVAPVVAALSRRLDVAISIDTSNPQLMTQAASLGAGLINDVRALRRPGALAAAAASGLPVCLMHMQGEPDTMQCQPQYVDVVADVLHFLQQRVAACSAAGMGRERILIDPGFGFGKTTDDNLQLLRQLPQLAATAYPVVVGVSRKSMIGTITGRAAADRLAGGLALAAYATLNGAAVLRVHDVAETRDVVQMMNAVMRGKQE
jgi:dihydropteroate synthase